MTLDHEQRRGRRARATEPPLLSSATTTGALNASHMKTDASLDPLREREDFKKLLADLENKEK